MKNIVRLSILLASCVSLLLLACDSDEQKQYEGVKDGFFPFDEIEVHPFGDTIELTFTSEVDWKLIFIDKEASWVTVSKRKGSKGSCDIEVKIAPYLDGDDDERSAEIQFKNSNNYKKIDRFKITQKKACIDVHIDTSDDNNMCFDWRNGDYDDNQNGFKVTSSVEYKIEIGSSEIIVKDKDNNQQVVGSGCYGGVSDVTTKTFSVAPTDYNFSAQLNEIEITITPVRRDIENNLVTNVDSDLLNRLKKTISVSQEFLIFAILGMDDISEAKDMLARNNDMVCVPSELSGFSELGYDYLCDSGVVPNSASKSIVVALEDGFVFDVPADPNGSWEFVPSDDTDDGQISERSVKFIKYDVRIHKPNPKSDINKIQVPISLKDSSNVKAADIEFNLAQEPYVFKIERALGTKDETFKNSAEGVENKTYMLTTTGPWSLYINYNNDEDKWLDGNIEDHGVGDYEFFLRTSRRNMDTQQDISAELVLVAEFEGDILHTDTLRVTQEKYKFDICGSDGSKIELPELLTSFDTKEHTYCIKSSGKWEIDIEDNPDDWLMVSLSEGNGDTDFTIRAIEKNNGKEDRSAIVKLISKTHEEAELQEERRLVITQHHPYCELRNSLNDNKGSDSLKLEVDANDPKEFWVYCSYPWEIDDIPEWLELTPKNGDTYNFDGSKYINMKVKATDNENTKVRECEILIMVDDNGNGEYREKLKVEVEQKASISSN